MRIAIRVKPGAARTSVGGRFGDALVVAVTPHARDGKATEAALRAVADALGTSRSAVILVAGVRSRDKVIDVAGPEEALSGRLTELLQSTT